MVYLSFLGIQPCCDWLEIGESFCVWDFHFFISILFLFDSLHKTTLSRLFFIAKDFFVNFVFFF